MVNPGFTGGTTGWTNQGSTQQHHVEYGNECNPNTANNWATTCGITKGSLATVDNGGVNQTITLSEDTNMTTEEIQNGFTSTMSNDIWFWSGEDSVTMTQTLTDSSNNDTTQIRTVTGSHNYYQTYTDSITVGNNTSTDYNINAKIDIDDSSNSSGHGGPDIDNIELKIAYTYINPLEEDTQEIIDDINGKTLFSASTMDKKLKGKKAFGGNIAAAQEIGTLIAKLAKDSGLKDVVFDRGAYLYHGRVKALAESARGNGLVF